MNPGLHIFDFGQTTRPRRERLFLLFSNRFWLKVLKLYGHVHGRPPNRSIVIRYWVVTAAIWLPAELSWVWPTTIWSWATLMKMWVSCMQISDTMFFHFFYVIFLSFGLHSPAVFVPFPDYPRCILWNVGQDHPARRWKYAAWHILIWSKILFFIWSKIKQQGRVVLISCHVQANSWGYGIAPELNLYIIFPCVPWILLLGFSWE